MMTLSPQERREIAAEACCDARTVGRHLRGEPLRSSCTTRIERAMRKLGIVPRATPPGPASPVATR
jgi:hypothetical protein